MCSLFTNQSRLALAKLNCLRLKVVAVPFFRTSKNVPRVYINKSKPGAAGGFLPWLMGLGGDISFNRKTDLILQDDCDDTVRRICSLAGWEQELDAIQYEIMEP